MPIEVEDKMCAFCKWTDHVQFRFFCGNPNQTKEKLVHGTKYNDVCELFKEQENLDDKYNIEETPK